MMGSQVGPGRTQKESVGPKIKFVSTYVGMYFENSMNEIAF